MHVHEGEGGLSIVLGILGGFAVGFFGNAFSKTSNWPFALIALDGIAAVMVAAYLGVG